VLTTLSIVALAACRLFPSKVAESMQSIIHIYSAITTLVIAACTVVSAAVGSCGWFAVKLKYP